MEHFTYFPAITYNTKNSRNILTRIAIVRDILKKYKVFYPYTIKDGERPDTIAHDYYSNSDYEWLVCLCNNIVDIYSEWPKSYSEFYRYIRTTYGDIATAQTTINHYKYTGIGGESTYDVSRKSWKMSVLTYNTLSSDDKSGWVPVYVYDYELELNEAKRKIVLLSNVYLQQVDKEVKELLLL